MDAPLTNHSLIQLELKPTNTSRYNKGFWKINSNLLNDDDYSRNIRALLEESLKDPEIQSYVNKLEFFKYKVRKYSIRKSLYG